jgi:hypothetical protein
MMQIEKEGRMDGVIALNGGKLRPSSSLPHTGGPDAAVPQPAGPHTAARHYGFPYRLTQNKSCLRARRDVKLHHMSCRDGGPGRRGYHHGNLREALIQAALSLIGEKGPAGFTIAEAARSAGVSPAAPYRHFRDREELMGDVARLGKYVYSSGSKLKPDEAYRAFRERDPSPEPLMEKRGLAGAAEKSGAQAAGHPDNGCSLRSNGSGKIHGLPNTARFAPFVAARRIVAARFDLNPCNRPIPEDWGISVNASSWGMNCQTTRGIILHSYLTGRNNAIKQIGRNLLLRRH